MHEKAQAAIFRSGTKYYAEGEKSTKYFYNLEKFRSGAKHMNCVLMPDGSCCYDLEQILQEQFKFYSKLYASEKTEQFCYVNDSGITLNGDQRESLEGLVQMHKLATAVKQMSQGKSPGCDGIPIKFYIVFFDRIKDLLLDTINYAYIHNILHDSALRGIISLIPKKGKDIRVIANMRPITLLNCDYKLIEKVLANRLKPVLKTLVNQDQKGYLQDRRISANIRRILDLILFTEEEALPGIIISIDFEKCFDQVELQTLISAMEYFNIGPSYQRWIWLTYSNPRACVTNNGFFTHFFKVTRSVKQGGSNSTYFFLLIAEILAIEIHKNQNLKVL